MLGGSMVNSRGDVYSVEYSSTLLQNKAVEIPVATGVRGQIVKLGMDKEGDVSANNERDRAPSHRLTMRLDYLAADAITDGLYYKETHYKHPATSAWVAREEPIVYKISVVYSVFSVKREVSVGLTRHSS